MSNVQAESRTELSSILIAAVRSLDSCAVLLASMDPEKYGRASPRLFDSTIGQHVRHSVDHFAAVIGSLEGNVIDYDLRRRDTPVEREASVADRVIRELAVRIAELGDDVLAKRVQVRIMVSDEGAEAELGSTFGRELVFATHHATHHFAMIASIAGEMGVAVPQGFGKAPSTVNHERSLRREAGR